MKHDFSTSGGWWSPWRIWRAGQRRHKLMGEVTRLDIIAVGPLFEPKGCGLLISSHYAESHQRRFSDSMGDWPPSMSFSNWRRVRATMYVDSVPVPEFFLTVLDAIPGKITANFIQMMNFRNGTAHIACPEINFTLVAHTIIELHQEPSLN